MNTKQVLVICIWIACFVNLTFVYNNSVFGQMVSDTASAGKIEVKHIEKQNAVVIKLQVPTKEIGSKMTELYSKLFSFIGTKGINPSGSPFAVYYDYNPEGNTTFEVGVPINVVIQGNEEIIYKEYPSMKVISCLSIGPYSNLGSVYGNLMKHIKDNNLQVNGASWEIYLTDPMKEKDPNKYQTLIYFPIK